ncbi:universal stress protein [Streptomyces sp. NPDC002033]|uniref:universal stress protein n=1 Tax=unclassified Streptomyces TaxID=2593676 RepID=UPI0033212F4C
MRRRVVVGVSGSTGSLTALHRAAAEARARRAELWAVLAWQAPGGGPGSRTACADVLYPVCRAAAVERLRQALDRAFGAAGPGVVLAGQAVRGTPGAVLVDAARDGDDLLVVGAGSRGGLLGALRPSVARYCLAHAPCPVLTVPPSPLQATLEAVRRRGAWHVPLDARELTE